MKTLSQTARQACGRAGAVALVAALQLIAMSVVHAGDRSKPYLTADAQNPTAVVAHQNESDPGSTAQVAVRDASTEQFEKLLLHSALADSSAFGLLQALQQPAKPAPAATPSTSASKVPADECRQDARKRI
jgi:hypothetical protein